MAGAPGSSYVVKASIVNLLVFADIVLNAVVDSNQFPAAGIIFPVVVLVCVTDALGSSLNPLGSLFLSTKQGTNFAPSGQLFDGLCALCRNASVR